MADKIVFQSLDILMNPENDDNIILHDADDQPIEFEQHAFIVFDNRNFVILRPVIPIKGMNKDEAFVYEILEGTKPLFALVEDQSLIDEVFKRYKELYNKNQKKG